MSAEEYFGMVINIIISITLLVLIMIFFYMIYGEKDRTASLKKRYALKISRFLWRLMIYMRRRFFNSENLFSGK